MRRGLKKLVLTLAIGAISGSAMAANDGDLGATSSGDFLITLVHASGVRIWGLQDFTFDTEGLTTQQQSNIDLCIFTNDATSSTEGQYDIIATSSDATLINGANETLNYKVEFSDSKGDAGTYKTLISEGAIKPEVVELKAGNLIDQPDPTLTSCLKEANANIRVTIDPGAAASGIYLATVNLLISPN